jgi:hypothetical protein
METMYSAIVNSPLTNLSSGITEAQTTIAVINVSKLPDAPNLATIGTGEDAETILYTSKDAGTNTLTGVTRGFQGVAKAWEVDTPIARMFTAYDFTAFKANIESLLLHNHDIDTLNKKTILAELTSEGYFAFAETPINATDYSAIFKITVTSAAATTLGHILYVIVEGWRSTVPTITIISKVGSAFAAISGLYNFRVIYPSLTTNGYRAYLELYSYNTTLRSVKIELLEASNVTLLDTLAASTYDSANQKEATVLAAANGLVTNQNINASLTGNASTANGLYNSVMVAGEALTGDDFIYNDTDGKWYKLNVNGRAVPIGAIIGRTLTNYAIGAQVGASLTGKFTLSSGVTDAVGSTIYLRGSITGSTFITDGVMCDSLAPGYSYMRLGTCMQNITSIYMDGNNTVYTVDAEGYIERINGLLVEGHSPEYTATIGTTWVGTTAPFTQNLSVAGIKSTDTPFIVPIFSNTPSVALSQQMAWGMISKIETVDNGLLVTCLNRKPTIEIPIRIKEV